MNELKHQQWLEAVLTIAKHYRMECSPERIRLHLDWNKTDNLDELLFLMTRQIGLNVRKVDFTPDIINPWRLPLMVVFHDGQVGVIDKIGQNGQVSVQLSGDQGLTQHFALEDLHQLIQKFYILRP